MLGLSDLPTSAPRPRSSGIICLLESAGRPERGDRAGLSEALEAGQFLGVRSDMVPHWSVVIEDDFPRSPVDQGMSAYLGGRGGASRRQTSGDGDGAARLMMRGYNSLSRAISAVALPGAGAGPAGMRGRRGFGMIRPVWSHLGPAWREVDAVRADGGRPRPGLRRPSLGGQAPSSCSLLSGVGFYD